MTLRCTHSIEKGLKLEFRIMCRNFIFGKHTEGPHFVCCRLKMYSLNMRNGYCIIDWAKL